MLIEETHVNQAVLDLLLSCDLVVSDITNNDTINFYGIYNDARPQAVIGLEILQNHTLLRSLAVSEPLRRLGYGKLLVKHAEQVATKLHRSELFLLTETAEHFFLRQGYQLIDRNSAPGEIKETAQFSSLCNTSCSLLYKKL